MHAECSPATAGSPPVCKHWQRRGLCLFQDHCVYSHPPECLKALQATAARLAALQASLRTTNDLERLNHRGPGRRNHVRKRFRAGAFRRWLLDTFGLEALARGSGVLDVAAGKGELAFELRSLNAVPATALEPRQLQFQKCITRLQRGYYDWNAALARYNTRLDGGDPGDPAPPRVLFPNHIRVALADCLLEVLCEAALQARGSGTDGEFKAAQSPHPRSPPAVAPKPAMVSPTSACIAPLSSASSPTTLSRSSSASSGLDRSSPRASPGGPAGPLPPAPPMPEAWPAVFAAAETRARALRWSAHGLVEKDPWAGVRGRDGAPSVEDEAAAAWMPAGTDAGEASSSEDDELGDEEEAREAFDVGAGHRSASRSVAFSFRDKTTDHGPRTTQFSPLSDQGGPAPSRVPFAPVTDPRQAWQLVQRCSMVVGMHPDQATEPAVDLALALGRPWAVVPCCVYGGARGQSRRLNGRLVRSHGDFVEYLRRKAPGVRVAKLPFEGKNTVVYWMGPSQEADC